MSFGEEIKHESFAMLGISRAHCGGGQALFGSSILHNEIIKIRIAPAKIDRHLNRDWFHATRVPYIEVEMSYSQFAEAITALNVGDGVPVTLKYLNGRQIEECPYIDKRQTYEKEFEKEMLNLNEELKLLTEKAEAILNEKKAPTKADKTTILNSIQKVRKFIYDHVPFIQKSFNEQMDKTVLEAKGEVEGFIMNKVMSAGLEGLQKEIKLLKDSE